MAFIMDLYMDITGRLGNVIYRYFAAIILCLMHRGQMRLIGAPQPRPSITIDDALFLSWLPYLMRGQMPPYKWTAGAQYRLYGYFQHDYTPFRSKICDYIKHHPEDALITDRNDSTPSGQLLLHDPAVPIYRIVVHLRLEDFCAVGLCMHPDSVVGVIDRIQADYGVGEPLCFVLNAPKTDHERQYLHYITRTVPNFVIESNTVMQDFHIMRHAEVLVCSCSTLSWAAAFLSEKVRQVYLPNREADPAHRDMPWETVRRPAENTVLYDYSTVDFDTLQLILSLE